MAITPNKDQVKGELKDLGGKIQEEAGKLVGSKEQQAKGLKKQAEGKLQKTVGNLKEAVTDADHESIGASTARTGDPSKVGGAPGAPQIGRAQRLELSMSADIRLTGICLHPCQDTCRLIRVHTGCPVGQRNQANGRKAATHMKRPGRT